MITNPTIPSLRRLEMFKDLDATVLAAIAQNSILKSYQPGEFVFRSNDSSSDMSVLISGQLAVLVTDPLSQQEIQINTIEQGETIGELALVESAPRTASIQALENSQLLFIPIEYLRASMSNNINQSYLPLITKLGKLVVNRLTSMNNDKMLAIDKENRILKDRANLCYFMVMLIVGLNVYSFFIRWLVDLLNASTDATLITVPILVALATYLGWLACSTDLTLKDLGLTTHKWQAALRDSILFSLAVMVILTIGKYWLIKRYPQYGQFPIVDLIQTKTHALGSTQQAIIELLWGNAIYFLFIAPIQEFIARGILQSSLEKFLLMRNKKWVAILLSNLIFSSLLIVFSTSFALLTLICGIFFGWLYSRTRTLISPIVAHIVVGFWGLSVLNAAAVWPVIPNNLF